MYLDYVTININILKFICTIVIEITSKPYIMKSLQLLFSVLFIFISSTFWAQVGIGTTTPDAQAALDIQSSDKGLLVPRVADHTSITPTSGSDYGLLVFDTTSKSFWYWDGTLWSEVWSSTESDAWKLSGNSGTTVGTDYIGTSDGNDLSIARNGTEEIRVLTDQVSINDATPLANDRFTVVGDTDEYAVNGYASGTGVGVYGQGPYGVIGTGVYGVYGIVDGSTNIGVIANNDNSSGTGLIATGGNGYLSYLSGTGATLNAPSLAGVAFASGSSGTGFSGVGNGDTTSNTLTAGSGIAATGDSVGVYGIATNTNQDRFGGYFESDGSYAYVGGVQQDGNTDRKILGNGTVSTIVKGVNNDLLTMSCPESPEILFQDYGIGQLSNGFARIHIDPNLSKNIRVDDEHPIKIFIQLEGECNGVYVTNKSSEGFDVKELADGNSNVTFSWSLVATRADETHVLEDGRIRISNNSLRFQPAPGPLGKNTNTLIQNSEIIIPKKSK